MPRRRRSIIGYFLHELWWLVVALVLLFVMVGAIVRTANENIGGPSPTPVECRKLEDGSVGPTGCLSRP